MSRKIVRMFQCLKRYLMRRFHDAWIFLRPSFLRDFRNLSRCAIFLVIEIRDYCINNFLVHAVELVYGQRHAILRPWNTPSFGLRKIFQDRGRYRFPLDRLFMFHYVLRSLQQRLHSQVMYERFPIDTLRSSHMSHFLEIYLLFNDAFNTIALRIIYIIWQNWIFLRNI